MQWIVCPKMSMYLPWCTIYHLLQYIKPFYSSIVYKYIIILDPLYNCSSVPYKEQLQIFDWSTMPYSDKAGPLYWEWYWSKPYTTISPCMNSKCPLFYHQSTWQCLSHQYLNLWQPHYLIHKPPLLWKNLVHMDSQRSLQLISPSGWNEGIIMEQVYLIIECEIECPYYPLNSLCHEIVSTGVHCYFCHPAISKLYNLIPGVLYFTL